MSAIAPWFVDTFLAASNSFLHDHRNTLVLFMIAYLRAASDITRANGFWTREFVASAAKWMHISEEAIRSIPGPANPGDGRIDLTVIAREEAFWHQRGLIASPVSPAAIVDTTVLQDAMALLRRRSNK